VSITGVLSQSGTTRASTMEKHTKQLGKESIWCGSWSLLWFFLKEIHLLQSTPPPMVPASYMFW